MKKQDYDKAIDLKLAAYRRIAAAKIAMEEAYDSINAYCGEFYATGDFEFTDFDFLDDLQSKLSWIDTYALWICEEGNNLKHEAMLQKTDTVTVAA